MSIKAINYLFCRYSLSKEDSPMSLDEQLRLLRRVRGQLVSHRRSDEVEDTFIMRVKSLTVDGYNTISWDVAQQVTARTEFRYDAENDEVNSRMLDADYIRFTSFVAIPSLGVAAISDRVSDSHLGASAGISRFKTAFSRTVEGGEADFVLAASHEDARRALNNWSVSKFSFTVRPFNPHPSDPGRALSEMFARDGIGRVQGYAVPAAGRDMKMQPEGYIEETVGLADAGYGQYGVKGLTPAGREASLKKPVFSNDRGKNEKHQAAPQQLRVAVEAQSTERDERMEAARALIEFYGE